MKKISFENKEYINGHDKKVGLTTTKSKFKYLKKLNN